MTTNTNDEAAFRQALLTSPGERPEVEYKSAVPFDDNTEFGLKLIKHILGMANAGGGWIVVGYEDDNLQPDASHSKEIAATYDTTRLSDTANRYVERGQSLTRIHRRRASGQRPEVAKGCASESGIMVL